MNLHTYTRDLFVHREKDHMPCVNASDWLAVRSDFGFVDSRGMSSLRIDLNQCHH
jgi:hypothetical protein